MSVPTLENINTETGNKWLVIAIQEQQKNHLKIQYEVARSRAIHKYSVALIKENLGHKAITSIGGLKSSTFSSMASTLATIINENRPDEMFKINELFERAHKTQNNPDLNNQALITQVLVHCKTQAGRDQVWKDQAPWTKVKKKLKWNWAEKNIEHAMLASGIHASLLGANTAVLAGGLFIFTKLMLSLKNRPYDFIKLTSEENQKSMPLGAAQKKRLEDEIKAGLDPTKEQDLRDQLALDTVSEINALCDKLSVTTLMALRYQRLDRVVAYLNKYNEIKNDKDNIDVGLPHEVIEEVALKNMRENDPQFDKQASLKYYGATFIAKAAMAFTLVGMAVNEEAISEWIVAGVDHFKEYYPIFSKSDVLKEMAEGTIESIRTKLDTSESILTGLAKSMVEAKVGIATSTIVEAGGEALIEKTEETKSPSTPSKTSRPYSQSPFQIPRKLVPKNC